jgi:hypothetical protein
MKDEFTLSVGLALDLQSAFRRNGWTEAEVKKLSSGDVLQSVREVVLGRSEITATQHVVDLDAAPFIPDGWVVEEHKKGGLLDLAKTKVTLFLTKQQKKSAVVGNDLRKDLADQPVLNANLLDFYLANPHLIPEEWKGKAVFFWGTIYRLRGGALYVRYLYWYGDRWHWSRSWLDYDWGSGNPAACAQAST